MVSKVRNVRLGVFSGGGCHHPNNIFTLQTEDSEYTELQKILDNDEEEEMSESDPEQIG